jgi:P-type Ca2+ transporter type 2C
MSKDEMASLGSRVQEMAGEGLRVLGVARAYFKKPDLPDDQHVYDFRFVGLVGFSDPLRPRVAEAVKECYGAGLRTIMITGDYPVTAQNIARQAGIQPCTKVITGHELDAMGDDELQERIRDVNVFARVVPEQKLRIVDALKMKGEIVVMTGDGVNDAPALKSAQIGIAMGGRGTEVAREAAAFVLLDDDFTTIVRAVKMGRRIFDNLKKALSYIFAIHVPIAGMSLLPVLLGWPIMLFPAHIAFLELIIDPVCSVVFEAEPEEKDVMKRPPKKIDAPLFDRRAILLSVLQGFVVLLVVLAIYRIAPTLGESEAQARALAFTTLVLANLGLVYTNRSWSRTIPEMLKTPNSALVWVSAAALFFLGLALYVPFLASIFRFGPLHLPDLAICLAASAVSILWFEVLKIINRRFRDKAGQGVHAL